MTLMVNDGLDSYFREHVVLKCVAQRRIEYAIEPLKLFFAGKTFYEVTIPECRNYAKDRKGIAAGTVRRELGVLKAAANHAHKWRRLALSEMPSFEMPIGVRKPPVWLFKDELATLLETSSRTDRRVFRFVQLAYHTASRKEAIETLQWTQVDQVAKRINLDVPGRPLTNKRRPIVPISQAMAEELMLMKTNSINQYVLTSPNDIRPTFDRITREAGLTHLEANGMRPAGRLTPHVLRHSRATHLLEAGKTPWAVASLLGDNVKTVLKVYGHVCPNYLEEVLLT